MAIGALFNALGGKFTGPEKATILLYQYENSSPSMGVSKTENTGAMSIKKPVQVGGGKAGGAALGGSGLGSMAGDALKNASKLAGKIPMPAIPSITSSDNVSKVSKGPGGKDAGLSYTSKMYTVAFNPDSLIISAEGGGLREAKNFGASEKGKSPTGATEEISYVSNERRNMTMSVDLIFDRVNPADSFTEIDFTPSVSTSSVKNVVGLFKEYSVQEEVEGFLSAIQSNMTNAIRFVWGDMCYTGTFNEITAEYTMFNKQGYPVRAKVYLRLTLIDSSLGYNYLGNFQDSFETVFKNGNTSWSKFQII